MNPVKSSKAGLPKAEFDRVNGEDQADFNNTNI